MKKTFLYLTLAVSTAILAITCAKPHEEGLELQGGEARIDLSVACAASSTRASEPGEENYNENKITHIDWFVFSSNAGTASAIEHGRETYTDKDNVTQSFIVKSISMQEHVVSSACSGYVYVIANLPDEYSHDETSGIQHTEGGTTVTDGLTLGALKTLSVTTTFDLVDTDGRFQAQDKFVMASELIPFRLTSTERHQTVEAKLSRVASKITLELDVVSAFDEVVAHMAARDTLYEEYKQTWYPAVNRIQVYLSYANSQTTLDKTLFGETPETYTDANFFTYTRTNFNPTVTSQTKGWKLTGTPFYSYPMGWNTQDEHAPFIKIILPWRAYVEEPTYKTARFIDHENPNSYHEGNKLVSAGREHISDESAPAQEFFYKVSIPADNNILQSNTWYKISLDVAILGGRADDMSMEMAGRYYVADWIDTDFPAGGEMAQGSYLKLARDTYYIYGGNSIEIPVQSSHDITTTVTGVRWMDYSTSPNPTTCTSLSDLTRQASTDDDGRVKFTFMHDLMSDISSATVDNKPDVSEYTFTVRVQNSAGDSKTITIIQQPSLRIKNDLNSSGDNAKGNVHVNWYSDSNQYHYYWNSLLDDAYYGQTYFGVRYSSSQYVYQYAYLTNTIDGYTYTNQSTENFYYNRYWRYLYKPEKLGGVNGRNTSGTNSNQNMYLISTSIAPAGMMIADPRSSVVNNINGTNWASPQGRDFESNTQRRIAYYYPTDNDANAKIKIAPKFRVASSYGIQRGSISYESAQRRCASYQEDGIPAGRWRVPTKAEIEFMIKLSGLEVIPSLFQPADPTNSSGAVNYEEGGYWTADGGVIYPWNAVNPVTGNKVDYLSKDDLDNHATALKTNWVRCVYDEWYWGETKSSDRTNKTTFYWGDKQIQ